MLPNNCLYDIGDSTNCTTLIENLITNEKEYLETLSASKSILKRVLSDKKQIESLSTWIEGHFAKRIN